MWLETEYNYHRFNVTCGTCPMVENGFCGQVIKEYVNTYLIELDMRTINPLDRKSLMQIKDFNGRVVIAKKYVHAVGQIEKVEEVAQ
ncbi:hypothetical protein [Paucilactobacillus sp. N302-9]